MAWLVSRAQAWGEFADALSERGDEVAEQIFDTLSEPEHVVRVFFDEQRLSACVGEVSTGDTPTYYLLTSDWSTYDQTTSWCPQVIAMTDWPTSRLLAPPPAPGSAPARLDADQAAAMLDAVLYENINRLTGFRVRFGLPYHFNSFPTADLLGQIEIHPSIFYGAVIDAPGVTAPQDLLDEEWQPVIRTLARQALGTERIDSRGLSAGLVDKRFVTYRREVVGKQTSRAYYLAAVPARAGELAATDEERFAHITDQLAYLNNTVAENVTNVAHRLLDRRTQLAICTSSLDQASEISRELRDTAMLAPLTAHRRRQLSGLMQNVGVSFTESRSRVAQALSDQERAQESWDEAVEEVRAALVDRVGPDLLPGQDPDKGPQPLASVRSYVAVADVYRLARHVGDEGTKLKNQHDQTSADWQAMVDYVRNVDRARDDQHNRLIGYGLAGVALLTAAPILVGSLGGEELREEISGWTGPLSWLGSLLTAIHTPLLALAVLGAAGVAAFLLVALFRMAISAVVSQPELVPLGQVCRRAWQRNREAEALVSRLSMTPPAARAPLLAELDALDGALSADLVRLWQHLQSLQQRAAQSSHALARIQNRIKAYVLWQELFQNRPAPLWTPRSVLLYRHGSPGVGGERSVSLSEFDGVLRRYGFDQSTREQMDELARQAAGRMGIADLVTHLGDIGILPSRRGWTDASEAASDGAPPAHATVAVPPQPGPDPAEQEPAEPPTLTDVGSGSQAADVAALFDKSGPVTPWRS
jgi:hypothetical protein